MAEYPTVRSVGTYNPFDDNPGSVGLPTLAGVYSRVYSPYSITDRVGWNIHAV